MALRRLHAAAGVPDARGIGLIAGVFTKNVLATLSGELIPEWEVAQALVLALDGDPELVRPLWVQARVERVGPVPPGSWGG